MQVEYIWIDGNDEAPCLRGKTKEVYISSLGFPELKNIPDWNFDGGSTGQGDLEDSDTILKPCSLYPDPFVLGGVIALCEVYNSDGTAHRSNHRSTLKVTEQSIPEDSKPWFGFEQEYTLLGLTGVPVAFEGKYPSPQGPYYCGVGSNKVVGRDIAMQHLQACKDASITLYGANAEVMPGQWEFQTQAASPLKASDDLWVARYILDRLGEKQDLIISYDPKPKEGWNGAGCHTNFSTSRMRDPRTGLTEIKEVIELLSSKHTEHLEVYGDGIGRRLTGKCETSSLEKFTYGIADRSASVRIPYKVHDEGYGYLEDRRPNANIDPYRVANIILKTTHLSPVLSYNK
jgi:glutamine synthetase